MNYQPLYFAPVKEVKLHLLTNENCPCRPIWYVFEFGDHTREVLLHRSVAGNENMSRQELEMLITNLEDKEREN